MIRLDKINKALIGLTLVGTLGIGGLISGVFSSRIQAALTLPPYSKTNSMHITAKSTPPATTQPSLAPPGTLAQDTFLRADQKLWGTASDGQTWSGDANQINAFTIFGATGQIAGNGTFNALLGPPNANIQVVVSGSTNSFAHGHSNFGAVLRWTNDENWYKAYIDGSSLIVIKRVNGEISRLGASPFVAQGGISYTLRFGVVGSELFAKVWRTSATEPADWMLSLTDASLPSGQGGIRVLLQNGVMIRITAFLETTATTTV